LTLKISLIDDMYDALISEGDGHFIVVNSKAVVEEYNAMFWDIEASSGDSQ